MYLWVWSLSDGHAQKKNCIYRLEYLSIQNFNIRPPHFLGNPKAYETLKQTLILQPKVVVQRPGTSGSGEDVLKLKASTVEW